MAPTHRPSTPRARRMGAIPDSFSVGDVGTEVWDMQTGELLFRLPEEHGIVWSLSWNPDKSRWNRGEKLLAVGTSDGGLFLWDIGKVRAELDRMRLGW